MIISTTYELPKGHCAGFWMDPAQEAVEYLDDFLFSRVSHVSAEACADIERLFDEIGDGLESRGARHCSTLRMARLAIKSCCDDKLYLDHVNSDEKFASEITRLEVCFSALVRGWVPRTHKALDTVVRLMVFLKFVALYSEQDCYDPSPMLH